MKNEDRIDQVEGEMSILGRELGRMVTVEEMDLVAGGVSHTDSHPGTCTNEADCD